MFRKLTLLLSFGIILFLFAGCSDDEKNADGSGNDDGDDIPVPEELIKSDDPLELEDQYGLELGDTGYVIDRANKNLLEFTLNDVDFTQDYEGETVDEEVFIIADVTVKNHGDVGIPGQGGFEQPLLFSSEEADTIENGDREDVETIGSGYHEFPEDPIEEGEETTGEMVFHSYEQKDGFVLYFGRVDSNNVDYLNEVTFEFPASYDE